ncbi:MAG TPA: DUF2335 domain-containing protein [Rhabdochlamydiaceae bacterium]|nr:DUF2335 domain-containing protein [Rhabdochlamydiaceae bacterium]
MDEVSTERKKSTATVNPKINVGIPDPMGIAAFQSYSGPIPPPNFLEQYERMVPGSAARFLEEPHHEAEHRRKLEKNMVEAQIRLANRGQIMAFLLATICIIASFGTIFLGYSLEGLGALIVAIASFASIFLVSRKKQSN